MKNTKAAIIVLALLVLTASNLFGCRMLALMNQGDQPINTYTLDLDTWDDCFLELQSQSWPGHNDDGWAIVYYHRDSLIVAGEIRSADPAYQGNSYDNAYESVLLDDPYIVIAHVRKATTGNPNIPDPHPFIFNYNDIDYTFAHNGTIDSNLVLTIQELLYDPFIPETDVDSETYFMWIMQNIHENEGNIEEGIHDALDEMGNVNPFEARTFILTDGQDVYSYRDEDDYCYYDHKLYYDYNGNFSPFHLNSKILMSNFGSLTNPFWQYLIDKDELMYSSPSSKNVLVKGFTIDNLTHKRSFHEGWNWSSFPIAQSPNFYGPTFLNDMVTPGTITNVVCDQTYVDAIYDEDEGWLPIDFYLDNTHLFKLNFTESTPEIYDPDFVFVDGDMRDPDAPTIINVQGEDQGPVCTYWIGYTLLPTQNIKDAFGSAWDNVRYVFAEDWTYFDGTINRGGTPTWQSLMKTEGKNMEFDKGYLVRFHNDSPSFTWHYPNTPIWSSRKSAAEYFDPEDKATYEVLEIASIEGSNNVIEIGAFQDGKCIGATTVDSFPVQLLAYSDTNGGEITFQAISGNRGAVNLSQCYIYNENSRIYEQGKLMPRQNLFSSVKLDSKTTAMINANKIVSLDRNIPNPFTCSTDIYFRLSESRHVFVKVYNIKGELIANLIDGNYTSGKYDTSWNGKNINGKDVSAGLYFYKIESEGKSDSKKMLLIR